MNNFFKKRRLWIVAFAGLFSIAYIYITYAHLAFTPQQEVAPKPATVERGSIVDRNGHPLAVQTTFYHFVVTPKMINSPSVFAAAVASTLEMNVQEVEDIINKNRNSNFAYIKRKITQEQHDALEKIISTHKFSGFCRFDPLPGRVYPLNDLASQLIGYMGLDGEGLSGIEFSCQNLLSPTPKNNETGTIYGKNIYLTIDSSMQYKLEDIAKEAMEDTQAESITLIAAGAKTGEILSYISLPSANLNDYTNATVAEKSDRPAVDAYEPGSVFKIFTSAAYLDSGAITKDTLFLCDGAYERTTNLGDFIRIGCLDHHGWITVREALKYSCNDALAQMSDLIPTDTFLTYVSKFGFGQRTGVELPSETKGSVKDPSSPLWSERSKPTMSIGQEISVSALQMVQAAEIIANGGIPLKLTFIQRIADKDGNDEYVHTPRLGERVLKASTANYILSCMETTAISGTGSRANLGDISMGVKTGTAQMYDSTLGSYSETDFISNCMAIFPVEDPEIILYIIIKKAKGETYAGRIVAPVIAKAASEIIDSLGMTRGSAISMEHSGRIFISEDEPISIESTVPNFYGRPKRDLLPLLDRKDIQLIINGEGWVTSQTPAPGTPITENMVIELNLE